MELREIKIDFNSRGDPTYKSEDLNIQQFSKNVDKLSFKFMGRYEQVAFAARRNDGDESIKIGMDYNSSNGRYEYVFGQDETDSVSQSSWFSYIFGKLTITVYLIEGEQYKPMHTFNIFVCPGVLGAGETIAVPPSIIETLLNGLNNKVDRDNGVANNLTINGGVIKGASLFNCIAEKPVSDNEVVNKKFVDDKIKTYYKTPNLEDIDIGSYMIVVKS